MNTVNGYLFRALAEYSELPMQIRRDSTWTYGDAARAIHGVARALTALGVAPGDRVALISENRPRWFHAYAGILAAGGVAVPRGVDISDDELHYILDHAECKVAFAENASVAARIPPGVAVIRIDEDFPEPADLGAATLEEYAASRAPDDLAVILYTSGTTGRPKGVMLEQRNLAHNVRTMPPWVGMQAGDVWVSVLPSGRTTETRAPTAGAVAASPTGASPSQPLA